jgi:hypothetical protein
MKSRDVVAGLIIIVILITGGLLIKKNRANKLAIPLATPSVEERVTSKFGGIILPEDGDKADLNAVSGQEGLGEAVRTNQNGKFDLTVLADLSEPKAGYFYQAWIVRGNAGDENFGYLSLGALRLAKGGYLIDFTSNKDYSDYEKVVVTLEKANNGTPETHVLEGSF